MNNIEGLQTPEKPTAFKFLKENWDEIVRNLSAEELLNRAGEIQQIDTLIKDSETALNINSSSEAEVVDGVTKIISAFEKGDTKGVLGSEGYIGGNEGITDFFPLKEGVYHEENKTSQELDNFITEVDGISLDGLSREKISYFKNLVETLLKKPQSEYSYTWRGRKNEAAIETFNALNKYLDLRDELKNITDINKVSELRTEMEGVYSEATDWIKKYKEIDPYHDDYDVA